MTGQRYIDPNGTMIRNVESVKCWSVATFLERMVMQDRKVTPEMAAIIKLARALKIPYSWITGYYPGLNFGRIADVVAGELFPEVPAAGRLPADFPTA